MPNEWHQMTLGDLCEFLAGSAFPQSAQGASAGDYPFIKVSDMNLVGNERHISEANNWVTEPVRTKLRARLHPAGAVAFAKIGIALTYNRRRILDRPTILDNNMMSAVPRDGAIDKVFFYYLLRTVDFNTIAAGTALPYLNVSDLKQLPVEVPPLAVQHRIADVLGKLDDKIELNRRMNRTLEKMAAAIFKSWFIDFDPVHAKAEGRDPSLPAEIADLFPDRFEDSALGPIPKGLKVKPIGDAVRCVGGATPSTKNPEYWEGGKHPFVTPKDMSSLQGPVILDSERHITDAGVERISSKQLPIGTVILSSRAPIGYLGVATVSVSVNQGVIAMICDGDLPNLYVLHWTAANMDLIKSRAGGTTFAEISKRNFRPLPVSVPDKRVLGAFMAYVAPLHERITLNVRQNRRLAGLRDALLPKLLSGEIELPEGMIAMNEMDTMDAGR